MPENNLSMAAIIISFMAITLLLIIFSIIKNRRTKANQIKGLKWLSSLKLMLCNIQKHRGLSMGLLNGSTELKNDINNLQSTIARSISDIRNIDQSMELNPRWQSIIDHWTRISENFERYETSNNMKQHNQIIKNILYLIDDTAQNCDLLLLKDHKNKPMHIYWRELLTAAEHIGQARAIGTGVSASTECNSVSRIQLNYACEKIEEYKALIDKEIGCEQQTHSHIYTLLNCINNDLIKDKPSIKPAEFFTIATKAIDSLLSQFDEMLDRQSIIKIHRSN